MTVALFELPVLKYAIDRVPSALSAILVWRIPPIVAGIAVHTLPLYLYSVKLPVEEVLLARLQYTSQGISFSSSTKLSATAFAAGFTALSPTVTHAVPSNFLTKGT